MFAVEIYGAVRQFVFIEGRSRREAARVFALSRDTIAKMCRFSAPPGYVRTKEPPRPKLGPLVPVIDAILEADRSAPAKQRHTAKRIFQRLRDEHLDRRRHCYRGGVRLIFAGRRREVGVQDGGPIQPTSVEWGGTILGIHANDAVHPSFPKATSSA